MANENFTCPYCSRHTTLTNPDKYEVWDEFKLNTPDIGKVGLLINAKTCPNPECNKLSLLVSLTNVEFGEKTDWKNAPTEIKQQWQILPESEAIVLPKYIPKQIQEDYYQACRIRDLSPKASATLARRCLQGMIRDFWKINKSRLVDEIDDLKDKVDPLIWQGINAIRSVGNIGAHMEKDINLIIDVDPNEAQMLIGLIETLIKDWYVSRHNKQNQLEQLNKLAGQKEIDKKSPKSNQ